MTDLTLHDDIDRLEADAVTDRNRMRHVHDHVVTVMTDDRADRTRTNERRRVEIRAGSVGIGTARVYVSRETSIEISALNYAVARIVDD